MRAGKAFAIALIIALAGLCIPAKAEISAKIDGWHSWQTDEASAVTEACCFTWRQNSPSRTGCKLDGGSMSYSSGGDCAAGPGRAQYYVLVEGGEPRTILVLSEACPVETSAEIANHGMVSAADNIAWFRGVIEDNALDDDVREEALFALVLSESNLAFDYLDQLLSRR